MDFGIARSMQEGSTQTAAGSVIGTLEYMAPEQAQGTQVDQRADQYAFGLIFYDMLVGRQRLARRDNPMTELLARLQAAPPAPRTINPDLPEAVEQIVMRCLQPTARRALCDDGRAGARARAADTGRPPPHRAARDHHAARAAAAALATGHRGDSHRWPRGHGRLAGLNPPGPPPAAVAKAPISVLVADFNNKTGDPVFDGVVEQALGLGIEGASFISAYSRTAALRAAAVIKPGAKLDETTARLVARRQGVGLIIAGEIEQRGAAYHITTRALGAGDDGPPLYTLEADASGKGDILETVGALAGKVRTALGDTTVPSNGPASNETFTAGSLEAAQAYVKGQELQAAGRREDAIVKYEEAVKLDPNMGRAYAGIAAQHGNLGRIDIADQYYAKALSLIDRMTDREKYRTRGGYYLFKRKTPEAIKEYTELLQAFPGDSTGRHQSRAGVFLQPQYGAGPRGGPQGGGNFADECRRPQQRRALRDVLRGVRDGHCRQRRDAEAQPGIRAGLSRPRALGDRARTHGRCGEDLREAQGRVAGGRVVCRRRPGRCRAL